LEFNKAQKDAVNVFRGPGLVLAGPGSGKTAVVTARTERLIKRGVGPENILVVSFTRAAAKETEQRFKKLMPEISGVTFGTFHSVFFKILRFAYGLDGSNIIREEQSDRILRELAEELGIIPDDAGSFICDLKSEIGKVKSSGQDPLKYHSLSIDASLFPTVFGRYNEELLKRRLYDFDDMLTETLKLFRARPDILEAWRDRYRFIMVDEFQDINPVQYENIKMIAAPQNNLFVVGDDDQSIYGFRGADPGTMVRFAKDFPEAQLIKLSVNHRSGKAVVDAASRVISHNTSRFEKEITAFKKENSAVKVMEFQSLSEETDRIADMIEEFHARGVPYREIAILTRTVAGSACFLGRLSDKCIPVNVRDRIPGPYDSFQAADMLSYIRASADAPARADVVRIMNRPCRWIPRDIFLSDPVSWQDAAKHAALRKGAKEGLERLRYDLFMIGKCTPSAAITYIRRSGYDGFLSEYGKERGIHIEDLTAPLDKLKEDANGFLTHEEWLLHVERTEQALLDAERERSQGRVRDAVTLSTMHGAKGLEYRIVFIPDAVESVMPYKKAISAASIEEERRLFYVAMTRAKSGLFVSYCTSMNEKKTEVSRFVKELREDEKKSFFSRFRRETK
jgi:DNA helicase-2/ATP-dependent DNA helicase PcrA